MGRRRNRNRNRHHQHPLHIPQHYTMQLGSVTAKKDINKNLKRPSRSQRRKAHRAPASSSKPVIGQLGRVVMDADALETLGDRLNESLRLQILRCFADLRTFIENVDNGSNAVARAHTANIIDTDDISKGTPVCSDASSFDLASLILRERQLAKTQDHYDRDDYTDATAMR